MLHGQEQTKKTYKD